MALRALSIASLLAAALVSGCASPYAPQEFDFSELDGISPGFVESVLPSFASPLHGERVLVRLDNGFAVEGTSDGLERLEPGQRVRVVRGVRGPRVLVD